MDQFLDHLTRFAEQEVLTILGPSADRGILGRVTIVDLIGVLIYLSRALFIDRLIASAVRRRTLAMASRPDSRLPHRMLSALGKPLTILIWIYALYVAATPLIARLRPDQGLTIARNFMDFVFDLGAFTALFWFLFGLTHVLQTHLALWAMSTPSKIDDLVVPLLGASLLVIAVVLAIILGLPLLHLPPASANLISKLTSILLIIAVAVLAFRGVSIFESVVFTRFDITEADNLRARKIPALLRKRRCQTSSPGFRLRWRSLFARMMSSWLKANGDGSRRLR